MKYLSLFSGIEACTAAWGPLGWECAAVAEIDPFPRRVLAHHYPNVPNLGDVTKVTEADIAALGRLDLVVFGSPCQDLSVAGKRKGLAGARSGLFFTAINIIQWARLWGGCRFALWENVPGAFSSNKGADFAAVVDALAGLDGTEVPPKGWGTEGCALGTEAMVEWSTLDAQWFGVAQRRRRVFALADFGNWRDRPPILLEPEGMRGDSAPRRQTGQSVAGTLAASTGGSDENDAKDGHLVIAEQRPVLSSSGDVSHCLNAGGMGRIDYETETMVVCATGDITHTLKAEGFDASGDGTGRGTPIIAFNSNAQPDEMRFDPHLSAPLTCSQSSAVLAFSCKDYGADAGEIAPTLRAMGHGGSHANAGGQVAIAQIGADMYNGTLTGNVAATLGTQSGDGVSSGPSVLYYSHDYSHQRVYGVHAPTEALTVARKPNFLVGARVRRLTPLECERLQAFPDGYTAVPTNGKPAADGPRYKALGNSMCVNVMRWIGHQVDSAVRFW